MLHLRDSKYDSLVTVRCGKSMRKEKKLVEMENAMNVRTVRRGRGSNLGALQRHGAGGLWKPLIPADCNADLGKLCLEHLEAGVTHIEVHLFRVPASDPPPTSSIVKGPLAYPTVPVHFFSYLARAPHCRTVFLPPDPDPSSAIHLLIYMGVLGPAIFNNHL